MNHTRGRFTFLQQSDRLGSMDFCYLLVVNYCLFIRLLILVILIYRSDYFTYNSDYQWKNEAEAKGTANFSRGSVNLVAVATNRSLLQESSDLLSVRRA
jgi:hypothetical protein